MTQAAPTFLKEQPQLRRSPLVDLAVTAASPAEPAAQVQQALVTLARRLRPGLSGRCVSRVELNRCAFWPAPRRCSLNP